MTAGGVTAWAGAVVAVGGAIAVVLGPVQSSVRDLIAQEAAAEVQKQMQPTAQKLESVVDLLRRQEDRAALADCREYRTELPAGQVRERRCRAESDYRWARWAWQDCRDERGADHPQCFEPEPLGDP